ncbi:restriction endonuclease subunit S [Elizabethkingia anophelis]|uniref:restriction endonuclease subunit S n=1 Tax=Elizabethkingia anophelis TaxID=1117645 RepID=UPI00389206D1
MENEKLKMENYKQTELGLIPEDWEVKKFNKFSKFYSGGTPLTSKSEYYGGEIPFIKSGEIYYDRTEQFLTQEGLNNSSAKLVYRGDLLYALYGANSGEVAISQLEGAINQAILCIQQNKDEAETIYLYNYLKLEKSNIINKFLQGGQGNLSADIIKNLQIPLPPLPEQKKIADCLSTWDSAIEKQNALINALTDRKKALMQQLLTGKKRLPGFSGEWKEVKLGEIAKITMGQSPDSKSYNDIEDGLYLIQGNADINNRQTNPRSWTNQPTKICNIGDIIMTVRAPVGAIAISKHYACIGRGVCAVKPKSNSEFLYYFLVNYENKWKTYEQGSTFTAVNSSDIKNIKLVVPKSLSEQTAIAEILATADRELQLQKEKLAQLQTQKKGLMQVLLTGKKRLMN